MHKNKTKTYEDSINTNVYDKKGSKNNQKKVPCKCLSIIHLDSVLYAQEKYHPQTFLEECKYAQGKIKTKKYPSKHSS